MVYAYIVNYQMKRDIISRNTLEWQDQRGASTRDSCISVLSVAFVRWISGIEKMYSLFDDKTPDKGFILLCSGISILYLLLASNSLIVQLRCYTRFFLIKATHGSFIQLSFKKGNN